MSEDRELDADSIEEDLRHETEVVETENYSHQNIGIHVDGTVDIQELPDDVEIATSSSDGTAYLRAHDDDVPEDWWADPTPDEVEEVQAILEVSSMSTNGYIIEDGSATHRACDITIKKRDGHRIARVFTDCLREAGYVFVGTDKLTNDTHQMFLFEKEEQ